MSTAINLEFGCENSKIFKEIIEYLNEFILSENDEQNCEPFYSVPSGNREIGIALSFANG